MSIYILSNAYFINFINDMRLCLQDEVHLWIGDKNHKVAIGLTKPQLGGYDYYVHG